MIPSSSNHNNFPKKNIWCPSLKDSVEATHLQHIFQPTSRRLRHGHPLLWVESKRGTEEFQSARRCLRRISGYTPNSMERYGKQPLYLKFLNPDLAFFSDFSGNMNAKRFH